MSKFAIIYRGTIFGASRQRVWPTVLPEILQIICMECSGTGKWPYHPDPAYVDDPCVTCKATGVIYVS